MTFKELLIKAKGAVKTHKIISAVSLLALAGGAYYFFSTSYQGQAATRYVLGAATKNILIVSVSGTGQVTASSQVDIKAETSGRATAVLAAPSQEVKAGQALVYIDSTDAQKTVRDAQASLESAQLALEKLVAPVDRLTLMQAEDAVNQAKQAKQDAQDNLASLADDEFSAVSNSFLELPGVMSGLDSILFARSIKSGQWNLDYYADVAKMYDENALQYRNSAYDSYNKARTAYDANFISYKATSRFAEASVIEKLLDETYETERNISDAIKSCNNLIQFYQDALTKHSEQDPIAISNTQLTNLSSYTGKVNSHLTSLLALQQKILGYEKTINDSDRTIEERQLSLEKVKEGVEAIEIRTQQLVIESKENALRSAKETLAKCTVRSPFEGVLSAVEAVKGDSINSGVILASLISKQRLAEITLNEIDVAKVKVGQKATLTFDAVENLSISGQVAQVDVVGAVSQGVVSYNIRISFDTQDERIKPGMSVSAAIITDSKADVLVVPVSAVKTLNGQSYVEVVSPAAASSAANNGSGASDANKIMAAITLSILPQRQAVETGLVNDSYVEILSGLSEGDAIVAQTVNSSSGSSPSSSGNKNSGPSGGAQMMRMF